MCDLITEINKIAFFLNNIHFLIIEVCFLDLITKRYSNHKNENENILLFRILDVSFLDLEKSSHLIKLRNLYGN